MLKELQIMTKIKQYIIFKYNNESNKMIFQLNKININNISSDMKIMNKKICNSYKEHIEYRKKILNKFSDY